MDKVDYEAIAIIAIDKLRKEYGFKKHSKIVTGQDYRYTKRGQKEFKRAHLLRMSKQNP